MVDIVKVIFKALESIYNNGIAVKEGWYDEDINKTHITFMPLNEKVCCYSDDRIEAYEYVIQVDVWSENGKEALELKNKVRELLQKADFYFQDTLDQYEKDTKIYHKAMRFKYVEFLED